MHIIVRTLKFAFLEGTTSWVPAHVERMDDHFENPRYNAREHPTPLRPAIIYPAGSSSAVQGNEPFLGRMVEEVGEDLFIYSSDYPHADRTEGHADPEQRHDIPEGTARAFRIQCRWFYNLLSWCHLDPCSSRLVKQPERSRAPHPLAFFFPVQFGRISE